MAAGVQRRGAAEATAKKIVTAAKLAPVCGNLAAVLGFLAAAAGAPFPQPPAAASSVATPATTETSGTPLELAPPPVLCYHDVSTPPAAAPEL